MVIPTKSFEFLTYVFELLHNIYNPSAKPTPNFLPLTYHLLLQKFRELLRKSEILAYARVKSAVQMKSKPMAWMKLNPSASQRSWISSRSDFIPR